jgi:formate/nitrite transporter FocA (FNT family)
MERASGRAGEPEEDPGTGPDPELEQEEVKEVEERTSPRAMVVHEAIRLEGEEELKRPVSALFWSGLAAGLSMGFSLVAEGLLRAGIPEAPWRHLVAKLGYSVGFLIVILGRQQLFTENTLTPILPLLQRRTPSLLGKVLRLWAVVLLANVLGAFAFALVIGKSELFKPDVVQAFGEIGREGLRGGFWLVVLRAIFAGWLIALVVWLLPYAETARVWVIIIITYVVGAGGFAHIVAGAVETLFLVVTGQIGWGAFAWDFFLPTLLGNILGGVALVAALNHAQVVAGKEERKEREEKAGAPA